MGDPWRGGGGGGATDGLWTEAHGQQNSQTTPATTSTSSIRQLLVPLPCKRHTMPHSAQPQHTKYWAPRTRKRHQQEHRLQRPAGSSNPTQHAKGRTGDCPGPRKGATNRRNVTQGGVHAPKATRWLITGSPNLPLPSWRIPKKNPQNVPKRPPKCTRKPPWGVFWYILGVVRGVFGIFGGGGLVFGGGVFGRHHLALPLTMTCAPTQTITLNLTFAASWFGHTSNVG